MDKQFKIRHVVFLVAPNTTLLTTVSPLEVFSKAVDLFDSIQPDVDFNYQTHVVSMGKGKQISTSSGLPIVSEGSYTGIDFPIDTLIITGFARYLEPKRKALLLEWIKNESRNIRKVCSVCSGAFMLAEAGLLDGKRATAHWSKNEEFAQAFPCVDVQTARIFIKDGNVYTAAGITSGIDLALALLEEDLGRTFALHVARWLVFYLKRPGNQSQFSTYLDCKKIGHPTIRTICEWIIDHLQEDIVVEDLAEQAAMSPRNFARVFVKELRITPARFINKLRVENAGRHLIETQLSIDEIASQCGLKTGENLRRQFLNFMETTPAQYRKNFQSSFPEASI